MVIKKSINYIHSYFLQNKIEKISKLNSHNLEIYRINIRPKMFFFPGKYSLVYTNKFNNKTIHRFKITESCDLTVKELFELSNIL